jgi:hypothetical protein
MALNIGSIEINNVYRGATPLSAIYRGANLVWPIPLANIGYVTNVNNFNLNKATPINSYVTNVNNFILK